MESEDRRAEMLARGAPWSRSTGFGFRLVREETDSETLPRGGRSLIFSSRPKCEVVDEDQEVCVVFEGPEGRTQG